MRLIPCRRLSLRYSLLVILVILNICQSSLKAEFDHIVSFIGILHLSSLIYTDSRDARISDQSVTSARTFIVLLFSFLLLYTLFMKIVYEYFI